MTGKEHFAHAFLQIMVNNGTKAGRIMMWRAIQAAWLEPDSAKREDLLAGLEYAGDQGWIKKDGANMIRPTAERAKAYGAERPLPDFRKPAGQSGNCGPAVSRSI